MLGTVSVVTMQSIARNFDVVPCCILAAPLNALFVLANTLCSEIRFRFARFYIFLCNAITFVFLINSTVIALQQALEGEYILFPILISKGNQVAALDLKIELSSPNTAPLFLLEVYE